MRYKLEKLNKVSRMPYATCKLYQRKSAGFTLIELLIYIAIIGVVVSGFVGFSINISNSREKTFVVEEVLANGRVAVDLMSQRIKQADSINTGSSTFGSDPGILSLAMDGGAVNPTLFDLDADDGTLRIKEGTGSAVTITSNVVNVTNLVFTNMTGTSTRENIKIELTIEYNNPDNSTLYNYSKSFETSVSLRQ